MWKNSTFDKDSETFFRSEILCIVLKLQPLTWGEVTNLISAWFSEFKKFPPILFSKAEFLKYFFLYFHLRGLLKKVKKFSKLTNFCKCTPPLKYEQNWAEKVPVYRWRSLSIQNFFLHLKHFFVFYSRFCLLIMNRTSLVAFCLLAEAFLCIMFSNLG